MLKAALRAAACLALLAGSARANDIANAIANAQAFGAKGDELRSLSALQGAEDALTDQLTGEIEPLIPAAPKGWDAAQADEPPLDDAGGGFSLSRGYQQANSSLTVVVVIDNPAVAAAAAMFQPGNPSASEPGWSQVRIGDQPAMLRYDGDMNEGEILIVLDGRALLEIDGDNISSRSVLLDTAKGWNFAGFHHLLTP